MSSPRITFTRHPDATPEAKREALANIYCFVLDCLAEKVGGPAITAPTTSKGDQATAPPLLYLNDPKFLLVDFDLSIPGGAVSRMIWDRLALLLIAWAREGW